MNSWPLWHLEEEPVALAKYVVPDEVARYLQLPGPSDQSVFKRVEQVYDAIVGADIDYAHEPESMLDGWQAIRPPGALLGFPGHGTCLDLVLVVAGALLVAGVPSIPVITDHTDRTRRHALLLIQLRPSQSPGNGVMHTAPADLREELIGEVDGHPSRYLALDVTAATDRGLGTASSFAESVRRGASYLTGGEWEWRFGVDLGVLWSAANTLSPPRGPAVVRRNPEDGRWLYLGGQGRAHFLRSARGQRVLTESTDAFVGRADAITAIRDHVISHEHRKPLAVIGAPGAGKSCVVARAVRSLVGEDVTGLAFHCAEATIEDFVSALGSALECEPTLTAVQEALPTATRRPLALVIDALDESRTDDDREKIVRVVQELSLYPSVRIVVATRDNTGETEPTFGGIVARLHGGRIDRTAVCQVDSPQYFRRAELVEVIAARLTVQPPYSSAGIAWREYRADAALTARLAELIADRTGTNYYLATMVCTRLAGEHRRLDSRAPDFTIEVIAEDVDQLLDQVLQRATGRRRQRHRIILSALSYGRGSGLTDSRWITFAAALGLIDASVQDLDDLRDGPINAFLEERRQDESRLTTFFHRSVSDALKARRAVREDEAALSRRLSGDWRAANHAPDAYLERFLPSHVLESGQWQDHLSDAEFLTRCHPAAVAPVARQAVLADPGSDGATFIAALPFMGPSREKNAQALYIAASETGRTELADELLGTASWSGFTYRGGVTRPRNTAIDYFAGHSKKVTALGLLRSARGGDLVVSASEDGSVLVWDPFGAGLPVFATIHAENGGVDSMVCWDDGGHPVIAFGTTSGEMRIWNPEIKDTDAGDPLGTCDSAILAMAYLDLPTKGRCIAAGTASGEVVVVQAQAPYTVVTTYSGHSGAVRDIVTVPWPGSEYVFLASGSDDHSVHVWDPLDPDPHAVACHTHHPDWVGALAVLDEAETVMLLSGGGDSAVFGVPVGDATPPLALEHRAHRGRVQDLRIISYPSGSTAVMSSSDDNTARIWVTDAKTWRPIAEFDGSAAGITRSVLARSHDSEVFISGARDGRIYLWHPDAWAGESVARESHSGRVRCSAVITDDAGARMIVTGSNDSDARVWESVAGGYRAAHLYPDHHDWVRDVAAIAWPGLAHLAVASASGDITTRIWDPLDPSVTLAKYFGHTGYVRTVRSCTWPGVDDPLLITAAQDGTARVWNPQGQPREDVAVFPHDSIVRCAIQIDGSRDPRILTASGNELWVWEFDEEGLHRPRLLLSADLELRDIAALTDDEGDLWAITTGNGGLLSAVPIDQPDTAPVTGGKDRGWVWELAVISTRDGDRIISVAEEGLMRMWKFNRSGFEQVGEVSLLTACLSVRAFGDEIVVTTSSGFHVFAIP